MGLSILARAFKPAPAPPAAPATAHWPIIPFLFLLAMLTPAVLAVARTTKSALLVVLAVARTTKSAFLTFVDVWCYLLAHWKHDYRAVDDCIEIISSRFARIDIAA